ncbi:sensor histidine kinase [Ideonella livida]|uniref:C4-dicarboxylate transport sensor protein DctB n=1 Tax=Ideonella livida TaxID=2707176 RepID=A0A7C9PIR0_9BURK|nr:ATP-binding protein [Ideonella livida]NDY93035.1 sensor histidine kinase [Ideonella livida]
MRRPTWSGLWLALLVLVPALVGGLLGYRWSERAGLSQLASVTGERLALYAATLESELARFAYLPSLVAAEPDIEALLLQPADLRRREEASRKLVRIAARAGASGILILADDAGAEPEVLASSLRGGAAGQDALPPRALQALLRDGPRDYFAANDADGTTDYYFVQVVQRQGRRLGQVVVRVNLAPLEATWIDLGLRTQSERLLVIDENEVVVLSSVPAWKYKTTGAQAVREDTGRYAAASLAPLDWQEVQELEPGVRLLALAAPDGRSIQRQVAQERTIVPLGARLLALSDPSEVQRLARHAAWGGAAGGALLGLLALYGLHRRRSMRQLLAARNALQQAHDQLEAQVDERTWQLRSANEELTRQIAQREEMEGELIQAGKLAVLGQMSAGISHEINQPLTALRALSGNALQFLEAQRLREVAGNLRMIDEMAERMGRIVGQLKSFARKEGLSHQPVVLSQAVRNVVLMLGHRLREQPVDLLVEVPDDLQVLGDLHRLEQVLLNLMGNALDALRGVALRRLEVHAELSGQRVLVQVRDSGPGLSELQWARLFEPFFTTKGAGEGLGLGLVISSKIVAEFGGSLRALRPVPGQGMVFEFDLPWAQGSVRPSLPGELLG